MRRSTGVPPAANCEPLSGTILHQVPAPRMKTICTSSGPSDTACMPRRCVPAMLRRTPARVSVGASCLIMTLDPITLDGKLKDRLTHESDPALRVRVLTDLLGCPDNDRQVILAWRQIADQPWVKATLAAHKGDGTWGRGFYTKYDGTNWVLLHLSEIGVPADVEPVRKGARYLLAEARSTGDLRGARGRHFEGFPDGVYWHYPVACLAAHPATALIRFGYLAHPVTQAALDTCRHLFDPAEGCSCIVIDDSLQPACYMTVPKVLKAFLAVPPADRTAPQRRMIRQMVRLLKKHRLHRYVARDSREWLEWAHDATVEQRREEKRQWLVAGRAEPRHEKPGWLRFSFPHSYNSDLLEVVLLLGEAGASFDDVIEDGLRLILSRRRKDGMWSMVGGLNGKMHGELDRKGAPSPWITYRALLAFKRFGLLKI
jgi:hypothetical protein